MSRGSADEHRALNHGPVSHGADSSRADSSRADSSRADSPRADDHRAARAASRSARDAGRAARGDSHVGGMLGYDDFAVTNDPVAGIPGRPSLRAELRRRALVWVLAAVVGLALGAGMYKEMPPPYKATTMVQLRPIPIPGVQPPDEILTEIQLAQSRTVAMAAMRKLRLPRDAKSVQSFMGSDTVTSPSDQFVQFIVKASSADDAVARAGALANAFINIRNAQLATALRRTVAALDQTIATQKQKLAKLTAKIATVQAQPTSTQQQTTLANMTAKQLELTGNLKALQAAAKSYSAHTQVSNTNVAAASGILDPPKAAARSKIKYPVLYAVGGMFAGLAIGMGWVIASALVSTRPRRRYDIARALGAPVRLSVGRVRVSKRAAQRAPESAGGRGIQQIVRHLRSLMPHDQGRASLAIVAADDVVVPALAAVALALSAVRDGMQVVLADLTPGAVAGRMLGCDEPGVHRHVAGQRQLTVAVPEDSGSPPAGPIRRGSSAALPHNADPELDHAYHAANLLLTLVTIDPGSGADYLRSWAREAVVIMTAGKSSATKARTIAELIKLSGTVLASAVVVGTDKADESLGVLSGWEDTERGGSSEEHVKREQRPAQANGTARRGQVRQESRTEGWADSGSDARVEVRAEARSEASSRPVGPEQGAAVLPEAREPSTRPRRPVDLNKDAQRHEPAAPEITRPERARTERVSGPETMPYADMTPDDPIDSEPSGAWRG